MNLNKKFIKRALGNLSLLIENSSVLVKENFLGICEGFIKICNEKNELVKFFMDILGNLSSFPEEINLLNLLELIEQGIIDLLIRFFFFFFFFFPLILLLIQLNYRCINANELNTMVLLSAVSALDFLFSNKSVMKTVVDQTVLGTLFKILKAQDWNIVIFYTFTH